jgi:hypothetical protein
VLLGFAVFEFTLVVFEPFALAYVEFLSMLDNNVELKVVFPRVLPRYF